MEQPINMLVVGECGDGKSTLINGLRDRNLSEEPLCGMHPTGMTKQITLYRCPDLDGLSFNLIDTPGVGDGTVTPVALIALLEEFLTRGLVPGGIRGVIVTAPICGCRIRLGAQVVQIIVNKGFVAPEGEDKYANIILAGTKADKADDEEKDNFMRGTNGNPSLREVFFKEAVPPGRGPTVMVSKKDYRPLLDAIKRLPVVSIVYKAPEAKVLSSALAEKLGMTAEAFETELTSMRELVAEQSAQIRTLVQQMHEAHQRHCEEMRKRDEQMAALQHKMMEAQRRQEEERKKREREFEQMRKEEREQAQREKQQEQERWEAAARAQQLHEQQRLQEMQRQAEAAQEAHQQAMRQMQMQAQQDVQKLQNSFQEQQTKSKGPSWFQAALPLLTSIASTSLPLLMRGLKLV